MGEHLRVEEGLDEPHLLITRKRRIGITDDIQNSVETVHRVGQHRVAEAIHDVRELGDDRCIEVGRVGEHEGIDVDLHAPCEFFEHHVLILHLGDEAGGLEQTLAVPDQISDVCRSRRHFCDVDEQPLVQEREIAVGQDRCLIGFDEAIVFGMENVVNRGEADVLVAAPITRDEVCTQHFVVVGVG